MRPFRFQYDDEFMWDKTRFREVGLNFAGGHKGQWYSLQYMEHCCTKFSSESKESYTPGKIYKQLHMNV